VSVYTLMRLPLQLRHPRRDFVCTLRRRAVFIGEMLELLVDEGVASGDVLEDVSRGYWLVEGTAESKLV
jgi:hypothetical protein